MISAKSIVKTYKTGKKSFDALAGVSLEIPTGESLAIIGKSGSGKSTLMHILSGMDSPTSGEIEFYGTKLDELKGKELDLFRNKNVGFVFQSFFYYPS